MNKTELHNYNLSLTLQSGQTFVWDFIDGYYYGFTTNSVIKLKQVKDNLYWQTFPESDNWKLVKNYLRLDTDYTTILQRINKDKYLNSAIKHFPNLRLLRQDFNETVIAFILSARKNIKAVKGSLRELSKIFGEKVTVDNMVFYTFPKLENLASATLAELKDAKIGYRARFIKVTAKEIFTKNLQKTISALSEEDARSELKKLSGVGDKVADCVLLYSLGFDNAVPLDVWGQRFLTSYYGLDPKLPYAKMREWIRDYFEGFAGWAGQYLFEYIRNLKPPSQRLVRLGRKKSK